MFEKTKLVIKLKKNYDIKRINGCYTLENLKETLEAFQIVDKEFPGVIKNNLYRIKYLSKGRASAIAYNSPDIDNSKLKINLFLLNNLKEEFKGTIYHEIGHLLCILYIVNQQYQINNGKLTRRDNKVLLPNKLQELKKNINQYGIFCVSCIIKKTDKNTAVSNYIRRQFFNKMGNKLSEKEKEEIINKGFKTIPYERLDENDKELFYKEDLAEAVKLYFLKDSEIYKDEYENCKDYISEVIYGLKNKLLNSK